MVVEDVTDEGVVCDGGKKEVTDEGEAVETVVVAI